MPVNADSSISCSNGCCCQNMPTEDKDGQFVNVKIPSKYYEKIIGYKEYLEDKDLYNAQYKHPEDNDINRQITKSDYLANYQKNTSIKQNNQKSFMQTNEKNLNNIEKKQSSKNSEIIDAKKNRCE